MDLNRTSPQAFLPDLSMTTALYPVFLPIPRPTPKPREGRQGRAGGPDTQGWLCTRIHGNLTAVRCRRRHARLPWLRDRVAGDEGRGMAWAMTFVFSFMALALMPASIKESSSANDQRTFQL